MKTIKIICLILAFQMLAASAQQKPELVVQKGHSTAVATLVFSGDGKILVSGEQNGTIKMWDLQTGANVRSIELHMGVGEVKLDLRGKPKKDYSVNIRGGDTVTAIAGCVKDYEADLLVIGARDRNALSRLVLGSTAYKVLTTIKCPIYVIHESASKMPHQLDDSDAKPMPE